jgi:hypothetical protein
MPKQMSEFRSWVNDLYQRNCKEREAYGEDCFKTSTDYFKQYKYWLKREFQYQKNQNKS